MIEVHIYDRDDPGSPKYAAAVAQVNARGSDDNAFLTNRLEIQNYLHPACITAEYQPDFDVTISFTPWYHVPALVVETVHGAASPNPWTELEAEKRSKKASVAKARLNSGASAKMTLVQLQEVDNDSEILGWFQAIAQRAN